jgi:hypothetical protein
VNLKDQRSHTAAEPPCGPILPPAANASAPGGNIPPAQIQLPDITSRPMVGVAGKPVSWGGTISITAAEARAKANGRCLVTFEHFVRNAGAAATGPFKRRWHNSATTGSASGTYPPVAPAQYLRRVDTLELQPGVNHMRLALDSSNQVAETSENNNLFDVTVQLAGDCGDAQEKTQLGTEFEKILK